MPRNNLGRKVGGAFVGEPLAGSYTPLTVLFIPTQTTISTDTVVKLDDFLPPGMAIRIMGVSSSINSHGAGSWVVDLGTSSDPDGIVNGASHAADGGFYEKCNGVLANSVTGDYFYDPDGSGDLQLTYNPTGLTGEAAIVQIWFIPVQHDTNLVQRPQAYGG
jgi:hypothetical protein